MATQFPMQARRGDPENGYMTVQQMVLFLRDQFDKFTALFQTGTATVPATTTSTVVTLNAPMASYGLSVTPLADPGGRWWVSAKSATGFTINLQTAAPVGGISFNWVAKGF